MNSENNILCTARRLTNVLVYSDNKTSREDLETILKDNLDSERYTVYNISEESLTKGAWRGKTACFVLAGNIGSNGTLLLEYFLSGGQILAFHSDLITTIVPCYKSDHRDEIVEVNFLNSPTFKIKNNSITLEGQKAVDRYWGHKDHAINVEIIMREDTNNSPAIMKLIDSASRGTAVFSSLFLETNCNANPEEEELTKKIRIQVIHKLLNDMGFHLNENQREPIKHTSGYFIGNNNTKASLIREWCSNDTLTLKLGYENRTIQFIHKGQVSLQSPSKTFLPVYVDESPKKFSSNEYYRLLTTKSLGQVLIYIDVVSTVMDFVKEALTHGIAVVAGRQLEAQGRGGNTWITPLGQAAITVQLSQNISPEFVCITQHVSALAAVLALRRKPYEDLDIWIKWPNDIYNGRDVKIGGTIANAMWGNDITVNIGTGVNINNKLPTKCVNDIISEYNKENNTDLPKISVEYFLAKYLSELEDILQYISKENNVDRFQKEYYKYWLHSHEEVRVQTEDSYITGVVVGVDTSGWLIVNTAKGEITVMPDGNTFDMMNGLIAPKFSN